MKKESDSSIARNYIKENKDTMPKTDIINHLLEITKLSKKTIYQISSQMENPHKYAEKLIGPDAIKSKNYIKDNIEILTKDEIIKHITQNTRLNELSAEVLYMRAINKETVKVKKKKATEEILYKGRKRNFFMIDDSKLNRRI